MLDIIDNIEFFLFNLIYNSFFFIEKNPKCFVKSSVSPNLKMIKQGSAPLTFPMASVNHFISYF